VKRIVTWLVSKTVPNYQETSSPEVRARYGFLAGWLSIALNLILAAGKAALGFMAGSLSLVADAIHSLSDAATSMVLILSFRAAARPADSEHPFGHGRMEAVATLVMSMLLILTGFELGRSAWSRLLHPKGFESSWAIIVIIGITILIKEGLGQVAHRMGEMVGSAALEADSWHHRLDAFSSVLVLLAFLGHRLGFSRLDGIVGLIIAVTIIYTGWRIAREGVDDLLGRSPSSELVKKIKRLVLRDSDVQDVHDVIVHTYGSRTVISLHIVVSDALTLKYGHDVSERVGEMVNRKLHAYTTVHLDPVDTADPERLQIEKEVRRILLQFPGVICYHDLRLQETEGDRELVLELRLERDIKEEMRSQYRQEIIDLIKEKFPAIKKFQVNIGPEFLY